MKLQIFTNAIEGTLNDVVAINPLYVVSVYEEEKIVECVTKTKGDLSSIGREKIKITKIFTTTGVEFSVKDSYHDVLAKLNSGE